MNKKQIAYLDRLFSTEGCPPLDEDGHLISIRLRDLAWNLASEILESTTRGNHQRWAIEHLKLAIDSIENSLKKTSKDSGKHLVEGGKQFMTPEEYDNYCEKFAEEIRPKMDELAAARRSSEEAAFREIRQPAFVVGNETVTELKKLKGKN